MYKIKYRSPDEMKDSGVEWLGMVPKDWGIKKLKHVTKCLDGKRIPLSSEERGKMQGDFPYWGANGIVDYINKYLLDEEVILLGEDGAPFFDNYKDVAFVSAQKIWVNNHIHILKPIMIDTVFLLNCLNTVNYIDYIEGSTRDKLTQSNMKEIIIQVPSALNQQTIANFLDIKTAQFDSIIYKKELLIKKLEEAKKSLISEVVTGKVKIVDGEMVKRQPEELKDSGVEWLGMIPKDWGIRKIKRLSNIGRGASPRPIDNPRYFDDTGEYAWTRIADVTASGKFLLHTKQTTSKLGANLSVKLEPQDLFISIAGSVGKPCITKIKACIHDGFVYLPKLKNKYVEFLYYIFYIGQCYRGLGKLGTQLNLNRETIGNIDIALPLTDTEINSIIKYIVYKEGRIEYLTATIASEIQKLKQAKQSLISEAVTGKIDLRDWEITQEGGIQ